MSERELKLLVPESYELPDLGEAVPGELGPVAERRIEDAYHDTADLRLARWGCTLRHRLDEGWTLKLPRRSRGAIVDREEITWRGAPDEVPARALTVVASLTRGAEVHEVARLRTVRSVRHWRTADGEVIAELCDDLVHGEGPDGDVRFREIEVELVPGVGIDLLDGVVEHLDADALEHDAAPKLLRVLGPDATAAPDVEPRPLKKRPTARQVIRRSIASSTAQLLVQLPIARLDSDPAGIHQSRVAVRRLRSDLATFAPLLDDEWRRTLEVELRWLIDELGAVRDGDVLIGRLRDVLARRDEIDDAAGAEVVAGIERERRRARSRLLRQLRTDRAAELLDRLVAASDDPPTTERADRPAGEVLPKLVRKRWKRLARAVEALGDDPAPEALHDVRIRAKKVRYASESVAPAAGRPAKRFAKRAARIQDELGDHNDRTVARDRLAALADDLDGPAAFAAGQLAQQLACEAEPHDEWRRSFDAMARRTDWFR